MGNNHPKATDEASDPIFAAIQSKNLKEVQKIIESRNWNSRRTQSRNADGDTPLLLALRTGNLAIVELVVAHADVSLALHDMKGKSPLMVAAASKNAACVRKLLECGAQVFEAGDLDSALHVAVESANPEIFRAILEKSDVRALSAKTAQRKETPLQLALRIGNTVFATELLNKKDCPANASDEQWVSAMQQAAIGGNMEMISLLVAKGASANTVDQAGNTPLHVAVAHGMPLTEKLLSVGAIPNVRNVAGDSLIHVAIKTKQSPELISLLLRLSPEDAHRKNRSGRTPIDLATEFGMKPIIPMIQEIPAPAKTWKLQFISDTHLEFGSKPEIIPSAPYLALLGDTGLLSMPGEDDCTIDHLGVYEKFLIQMAEKFEKVFVVLGNHEFYRFTVEEAVKRTEEMCKKHPNLVFMNRRSISLGGVRVVGATLWSFVPEEHEMEIQYTLNDYRRIKLGARSIAVADTNRMHAEEVRFIESEIAAARSANEKVVVLSHHAPIIDLGSAPAEQYGSGIQHGFCTDLRRFFGSPLSAWVYGHTHVYNDITINGTRVGSNPHGYPQEKLDVNLSCVYEIPL